MIRKEPLKLPDGWVLCNGTYLVQKTAVKMAGIWNNKNNEYYYKVFPKFEDSSFVVAKRLRSELQGE